MKKAIENWKTNVNVKNVAALFVKHFFLLSWKQKLSFLQDVIVTCQDPWVVLVTKLLDSVSAETILKVFSVINAKRISTGFHVVLVS